MVRAALLTDSRLVTRYVSRAMGAFGCAVTAIRPTDASVSKLVDEDYRFYVIDHHLGEQRVRGLIKDINATADKDAIIICARDAAAENLLEILAEDEIHHLIVPQYAPKAEDPMTNSSPAFAGFNEQELASACSRLLHQDVFGIEKHLSAWGVNVHRLTTKATSDKPELIDRLEGFLVALDCHHAISPCISLVADELLLNAMFHAPRDSATRKPLFNRLTRDTPVSLPEDQNIEFSFACDGRYVVVSVADPYGALDLKTVTKYLSRGLANQSAAEDPGQKTAGLGLFMSFNSCNKLSFSVLPGKKTEVTAAFFIRDGARAFRSAGNSLHLYQG